jgi:hypothetical protein
VILLLQQRFIANRRPREARAVPARGPAPLLARVERPGPPDEVALREVHPKPAEGLERALVLDAFRDRLETGDIIATGTPAGVGNSRTPKLFLLPGDVVEVEIEGVGTLRNPVAPAA